MKNENKLKGRDLINIGVFGTIYFVILFAVAMLGAPANAQTGFQH